MFSEGARRQVRGEVRRKRGTREAWLASLELEPIATVPIVKPVGQVPFESGAQTSLLFPRQGVDRWSSSPPGAQTKLGQGLNQPVTTCQRSPARDLRTSHDQPVGTLPGPGTHTAAVRPDSCRQPQCPRSQPIQTVTTGRALPGCWAGDGTKAWAA